MADSDLVLERTLDAPRAMVWKALTTPELIRQWWAPRPYQTPDCAIALHPAGAFYTRMTGPDGFEHKGASCVLEVVDGEKLVWTSALGPDWRPNELAEEDCGGIAFTAVITLEDKGDGRTLYRAVAMHRNQADRITHESMGFHDGWGTCADQLGEVASGIAAEA